MLLASASSVQLSPLLGADMPVATAAVSPLVQQPVSVYQYGQSAGPSIDWQGDDGLSMLALLHSMPPVQTDPPMFVIFDPLASGGLAADSAGAPGEMTIGSRSPAYYAEPPVQMNGGPGSVVDTAFISTSERSYLGPAGGGAWDGGPIAGHLDVTGTLDSDHPTMTYQIPLTSTAAVVDLSLRESGGDDDIPVLGPMVLYSPTGVELEQFVPGSGPGQMPPQDLTAYVRNGPVGGHLDVQITSAAGSSPFEGSDQVQTGVATGPSQSSNWNVSFVLDIQKQDLSNTSQNTGVSLQGPSAIGTLIVAAAPQSAAFLSSSNDPLPAAQNDDVSTEGDGLTTAVSSEAPPTAEADPEPLDSFNIRVSTGPLASRSASALGPTLASLDAEATQPVDRYERALSQDIDGLGFGDSVASAAWRSPGTDQESARFPGSQTRSFEYLGRSEPVVAIPGHGGLPIVVTSPGHGGNAQLTDLWATLPSEADLGSSARDATQASIFPADVPLASTSDRATDSAQAPNYVKAAFGLALGVGLTTGPLFPDLIASLPRRVPRWVIALRPLTRRPKPPSSRGQDGSRRLGSWLCRLFVST